MGQKLSLAERLQPEAVHSFWNPAVCRWFKSILPLVQLLPDPLRPESNYLLFQTSILTLYNFIFNRTGAEGAGFKPPEGGYK